MKPTNPSSPREPKTDLRSMKALEHQVYLEQLSARFDAPLPEAEQQALEAHLDRCAACREAQRLLMRSLDGLHALPRLQAPEDLLSRVQQELHTRARASAARGGPARTAWPQELLSAAALALLVTASLTLGGHLLAPSEGNTLDHSPELSGLLGVERLQAVELTFKAGDEAAARAVLSSAADLGARSLGGAPLRPGEALPERGRYFFIRREALALIVPESIASLREAPPERPGSAEAALPRPSPGWIRVHLRLP